ncbi:hypothetical protein BBP40_007130 [Aspergillus hancockii]|nr:hypothetical protein BBP40_007130 [Aspergillus hancockii]
MASEAIRPRGRPAHTPGTTVLAYTPNGRRVITGGSNSAIRIYTVGQDGEPKTVDEGVDGHMGIGATNVSFIMGAEDGTVWQYEIQSGRMENLLVRCALPVRDIAVSKDGEWAAVASELEPEDEATSRVVWHPDGTAFAAAEATRDVAIYSTSEWKKQKVFSGGHNGDVTAISWSPNGALLATAGADGQILLWETKTQKVLQRYDFANVINLAWHPTNNSLSFTTSDGELFIYDGIVPSEHQPLLQKPLQAAPIFPDSLTEISDDARRPLASRPKESIERRAGTPDSLDDILGSDQGMEDFVDDDDGAGYAEGLNLTGCVWTVDQETHNTVTVEFYDRELHRDFHFTDPYLYDRACLNEHGTLFSNNPTDGSPATIFYRPHETWTARADWRTQLPRGEFIRALALSDSYIVAVTTKDYVRVYTLFGTPFKVYRQKSPAVTCAAWRDYVMTIGNGPIGSDGRSATLRYSVENIKRDEICQNEDVVALPEDTELQTVFFSDTGDPCVYDSEGVLLVLQHWRTPGQARWVPLLDTRQLERLASGRKEETYWPVAVAQDKFHCIILKGGDRYPYFPRPLLSEFGFRVPISDTLGKASGDEGDGTTQNDGAKFEEAFVRGNVMLSLFQDLLGSTNATSTQRAELARKELELDKIILQMLAVECREGEERGMKALELVHLMKDHNGKMVEAAVKIAQRYGRGVLEEKIRDLAERRTRQYFVSSPVCRLAHPRHGILNEPRPTPVSPTLFSQTGFRQSISDELNGNPNNDHKPPDERILKLGRTLRILSPLLPSLLINPLPPDILSPNATLHLFPSTHPHLPVVKGRTLYRAALWTVPVAWSTLPLVGNVKLQILSERIVRAGTVLDLEQDSDNDHGDERLVVRWKTEPRREDHHSQELTATRPTADQKRNASQGNSHLSSSKDGTNKGLSVLLGGDAPIFPLSKEEQFTGLFIFSFDEEGRILSHTIEHADDAFGWERTAKFVTLTDWLIGKARGSLEPASRPDLAMQGCQGYHFPSRDRCRSRRRS